jgi:hypothetical protein
MGDTDRSSIPYFPNPRRECIVEAIPDVADGPARNRPFARRNFIAARGADNYADLRTPDTQISDFRIGSASVVDG